MEHKLIYGKKEDVLKGCVIVKVPTYVERMNALKEINLKVSDTGKVELNDSTIASFLKMNELAVKYTASADLVCKKTDQAFKSLEELEYYDQYQLVTQDIANIVLQGATLGN
jgi:hypothetical protein